MVNPDGTGNIQHWRERITDADGYVDYELRADEDDPQRADWELYVSCDGHTEDATEMTFRKLREWGLVDAHGDWIGDFSWTDYEKREDAEADASMRAHKALWASEGGPKA